MTGSKQMQGEPDLMATPNAKIFQKKTLLSLRKKLHVILIMLNVV